MRTDDLMKPLVRWLRADDTPPPGCVELATAIVVSAPLDEAFSFFANAENLEQLTPPWVNFRIVTSTPIVMGEGVEIDYRISLRGLPMPWRTRIDVWEPGQRFVDRQLAGPYRWWRHEHLFRSHPSGTEIIDRVTYLPRVRALSSGMVRRDVERIFAYRRSTLSQLFPSQVN